MPWDLDVTDRDYRASGRFDRRYETCREALEELERREATAARLGLSLADTVAVMDPMDVRLMLMTRSEYLQECDPDARRLVEYADPRDALRVVLVESERARTMMVSELRRALDVLEAASNGR